MQLNWEYGEDYHLVAESGSGIFPVQLQIEKTEDGSFWAYANGTILSHSTDLNHVKKICQSHHDKWHS